LDLINLPLALASGEELPRFIGFSRIVWLKPKSFQPFDPPAKAGGNLHNFHFRATVFEL
jgi:hypothetical protein